MEMNNRPVGGRRSERLSHPIINKVYFISFILRIPYSYACPESHCLLGTPPLFCSVCVDFWPRLLNMRRPVSAERLAGRLHTAGDVNPLTVFYWTLPIILGNLVFDWLIMSMGCDYVSELPPSMGLLFIPQVIYEHGESWWNYIDK
jgi:hypothetical protein